MKVKELIELLKKIDPEMEIGMREYYSKEGAVGGIECIFVPKAKYIFDEATYEYALDEKGKQIGIIE